MKIPPYSLLIVLFCTLVIACKQQPESKSKTPPAVEAEAAPVEGDQNKQQPNKLRPVPASPKSEGQSPKKQRKNALDTLRPKTA